MTTLSHPSIYFIRDVDQSAVVLYYPNYSAAAACQFYSIMLTAVLTMTSSLSMIIGWLRRRQRRLRERVVRSKGVG